MSDGGVEEYRAEPGSERKHRWSAYIICFLYIDVFIFSVIKIYYTYFFVDSLHAYLTLSLIHIDKSLNIIFWNYKYLGSHISKSRSRPWLLKKQNYIRIYTRSNGSRMNDIPTKSNFDVVWPWPFVWSFLSTCMVEDRISRIRDVVHVKDRLQVHGNLWTGESRRRRRNLWKTCSGSTI